MVLFGVGGVLEVGGIIGIFGGLPLLTLDGLEEGAGSHVVSDILFWGKC